MIDEKRLIKDLENAKILMVHDEEGNTPITVEAVIDFISNYQTVTFGVWTPCSEGLPKESGKYLVQYDSGYITDAHYSEKYKAWNYLDSFDEPGPDHKSDFVAWMPLPERWKPEK